MIEQMTVISPMAWRIRAYQIAHTFRWFRDNGVFIGIELSMPVFQLTPQAMQVDRMLVVTENSVRAENAEVSSIDEILVLPR
jgi:hypothetical protein